MKIEPELTMEYGREGLHVSQAGREIALVDCCELAKLHIGYGDDLDIVPAGWYMSRRERAEKWLKTQNQKGGICG